MSDTPTSATVAPVTKTPEQVHAEEIDALALAHDVETLVEAASASVARQVASRRSALAAERETLAKLLSVAPDGSPRHAAPEGEVHFQKLGKSIASLVAAEGALGQVLAALQTSASLVAQAKAARVAFLASHEAHFQKNAEFAPKESAS